MLRVLWIVGLFAACSGSEPSGNSPAALPSGETGTPPPADDTSTPSAGTYGIVGTLVGPDGAPLPGMEVLCCTTTTCTKSEADDDGSFAFTSEPGTELAIKTHPQLYQAPRWAAALAPAVADPSGGATLGTLYVPDLPTGVPFGDPDDDPQQLEPGDGLQLTLSVSALAPEPGTTLYDLAARRLPEGRAPEYPALDGETVVAVYALHPFATTSTSPIAVQAPVDLPAGTEVRFRTVSHLDGTLSEPVAGTSDGAVATTTPGDGITLLTHLVISTP